MKKITYLLLLTSFSIFAQTTSWTFDSALGNWTKQQGGATLNAAGGAMVLTPGTVTGNFLDVRDLANVIDASSYKGLTVKIKNTTVSTDLRFRATVDGGTTFQNRKVTISTGDAAYQTYYFNLNDDDGVISGSVWNIWTGNITGQYLRLTKLGGDTWVNTSTAEFDEVTFTPTSLSAVDFNANTEFIKVYPNPAIDNISLNANFNIEKIEIFNLSGQLIKQSVLTNIVSINELSTGVYVLKVYSDNNVKSVKFIKE